MDDALGPVKSLLADAPPWVGSLVLLVLLLVLAYAGHRILFGVAGRFAARTDTVIDDSLIRRSRRPALAAIVLLALLAFLPTAGLGTWLQATLRQGLVLALTLSVGWLGISLTGILTDYVNAAFRMDVADNLRARQIHTQMVVVRRILVAVIVVIVLCLVLMSIPRAREIGISLFASAGVAGLVIGMAARPALSNLIAGVQIALTGPIHIDDVVIVEGEWGRIEEISSTYVVVRIWDQRRLVVPLSYFNERPFQNWTRRSADIMGTVFVYADYTVPVDAVRARLTEIVEPSDLWDGRVCGLQVTNATERVVELRCLVSAADASKAWDLRCLVREKLIAWLQAEYPQHLPRLRAEMEPLAVNGQKTPAASPPPGDLDGAD
ncbi:MAG: mechanosensitive ion channel [Hyphomicrobiales bacterium]|nr:mechanosensitive ion channel [Hyphomicrobiales bacterium]MCP5372810.1 mechanosensitive ion channel [Hyphomicrobiales bacterium]